MPDHPLTRAQRWRRAVNWANLSTPLGLTVARLGGSTPRRGPRGLWLADGYRPPFPVAPAFTVGDVLVSRRPWVELQQRRPGLLEHEEAHSWQWATCLGLPFLPLYLVATVWSLLRTGDRAAANLFEVRAGLRRGGYAEKPVRPVREGVAALLRARDGWRPRRS